MMALQKPILPNYAGRVEITREVFTPHSTLAIGEIETFCDEQLGDPPELIVARRGLAAAIVISDNEGAPTYKTAKEQYLGEFGASLLLTLEKDHDNVSATAIAVAEIDTIAALGATLNESGVILVPSRGSIYEVMRSAHFAAANRTHQLEQVISETLTMEMGDTKREVVARAEYKQKAWELLLSEQNLTPSSWATQAAIPVLVDAIVVVQLEPISSLASNLIKRADNS